MGAEEVVGQFFGDAFEIGSKGFHVGIAAWGFGSARHPWPPALGRGGNKGKGEDTANNSARKEHREDRQTDF